LYDTAQTDPSGRPKIKKCVPSFDVRGRKEVYKYRTSGIMKTHKKQWFVISCSTAAALVVAGATSLIISRPAAATAQFAAETKQACGACHTNPQGGGALTPLGEKFKANGNKMPK
jgi:mono/diheme cytochrome c family protein